MKAVTIRQPWAWAIAAGHKRVENRTWRTSHRGPLAIHAAGARDTTVNASAWLQARGITPPAAGELHYGAIVAVCELVDVLRYDQSPDLSDDPLACGPYCWLLDNVQPLARPIPHRGWPALFGVDLPASVLSAAT